jgi:hypothetical protein
MQFEMRIYEVDPDYRWNWIEAIEHPLRFISLRDDRTFVCINGSHASEPSPIQKLTVRRLAPAYGSVATTADELQRVLESNVLELRQYKIKPGERARFAKFFVDKTLPAQGEYGMAVYGQFDDLDDENVFTWIRGFPNVVERDRRKNRFYQSAFWFNELQDEAFSMIEDYSNSLLVAPVR